MIFRFGEERYSRRIARRIVARARRPIDDDRRSWRRSSGAPSPTRGGSGSIRRRGRSRRCASAVNGELDGLDRFVQTAAIAAASPAGGSR